MQYEAGDPRRPRVPDPADILSGFPGRIAIPVAPPTRADPLIQWMANDDRLWSVTLDYRDARERRLRVHTVRSPAHLDPRGLPVEDLASAVVNYLPGAAPSTGGDPGTGQAWARASVTAARATRAEVGSAPVGAVTLPIDGVPVPGERVDLPQCAAVRLAWDDQLVFCVGPADLIDPLRLRTATPQDLTRS